VICGTTPATEGPGFAGVCLYALGLIVFPIIWGLVMDWIFRRLGARFAKSPGPHDADPTSYQI
jgi:hypothetical protein